MRGVETVQPGYYADLFVSGGEEGAVIVHVMSLDLKKCDRPDYINRPRLIEGRLPESVNECVVDQKTISNGTYSIGDTITVWSDASTELDSVMKQTDFRIVGGVESVLYVSYERGSASIGNGVISFFMYVPEQAFALPVYTEVYVSFRDTKEHMFNSGGYASLMDEKIESAKNIAGIREAERYQEVYDTAMEEIEKNQKLIDDARAQYEEGLSSYTMQIAQAESEIEQAEEQLELLEQLYSVATSLNSTLNGIFPEDSYGSIVDFVRQQGNGELTEEDLREASESIDGMIVYLRDTISEYQGRLWEAEQALYTAKTEGAKKLSDALAKINDGQKQIDEAKAELEKIDKPSWYVFDRSNNPGYSTYEDDALRVDNVSRIFPIFFILVATLVCTTTMTRMVEDDRMGIGTLKALGYSELLILTRYLVYSSLASLAGSILGLCVGFRLFPTIIFAAYGVMYTFPPVSASFRPVLGILSILVSLLCTGLSAYFVCRRELISTPAALMRPRTPKAGKRIFLEKIPFIWNRISFLGKVTIRNLIRYKSRVFMTIIGVAGCTALLFTGFGLRFAISSIVDLQYKEIFTYDLMAVYDNEISDEETQELFGLADSSGYITEYTPVKLQSVSFSTQSDIKREVYMLVAPDPKKINEFIVLRGRTDHEPVYLQNDGIVICEKLSLLYNVSEGDRVRISLSDTKYADFTVTGICENYTLNYVYMTSSAYEKAFGEECVLNTLLINMVSPSDESRLATQLLTNDNILALKFSASMGQNFRDLVGALDYIVVLIIACSGALAFVVLYNLANINVTERIREIATIKVLGFRHGEVASYINRENTVSSLFGIAAGLALGIPMEKFVIHTAEVDSVMFLPTVDIYCYIYAAVLAFVFTVIVNTVMRGRLKKINMVESLKSVE
ncbi:MAG: ABC transporter permease, partial [Eubacteriaceae bacterium]|nr:ABC transporter permease [Eubacteriaceae bacterium]